VVYLGAGKQSPDDGEGFLETADALTCRIEPDPGGGVFGLVPACAEAKLEPSPDTRCRLAASCATIAGWRKSLDSMIVPTRRRVVTAAAEARAVNGASC
jgi:hypothetical protein